jgi:hypothetical protein
MSVSCLALNLATRVERGPTMLCHDACSWLALPRRLLALSALLPHRTTQHAASNDCSPALPDGKRCAAAAVLCKAARGTDYVARHSHSSDSTHWCAPSLQSTAHTSRSQCTEASTSSSETFGRLCSPFHTLAWSDASAIPSHLETREVAARVQDLHEPHGCKLGWAKALSRTHTLGEAEKRQEPGSACRVGRLARGLVRSPEVLSISSTPHVVIVLAP